MTRKRYEGHCFGTAYQLSAKECKKCVISEQCGRKMMGRGVLFVDKERKYNASKDKKLLCACQK